MTRNEIVELINFLKFCGLWYDFSGNRYSTVKLIFQFLRMLCLFCMTIANGFSIYLYGFEKGLKGTIFFFPSTFIIAMQTFIMFTKRGEIASLLHSLEFSLDLHNEDWQVKIFSRQHFIIWQLIKGYFTLLLSVWFFYFTLPFIVDAILGSLGYLKEPYIVPLPLSAYLDDTTERNLKYNLIMTTCVFWYLISMLCHLGFIGTFCILVAYSVADLKIFRHKTLLINFYSPERLEYDLNKIVETHKAILRLNYRIKKYLGLPSAFQNTLASVCLCLCLYTASTVKDPIISVAYLFGVFYYLSLCFLFCILGQFLETESQKVFETLYVVPWYNCKPNIRKNLIMVIRQAARPILIDYRGRSPANLKTFMQILHTSYSYFMLLQSIT